MQAVQFKYANVILTKPDGWDEAAMGKFEELHAYHQDGEFISVWKPTDNEVALLARGAYVVLGVLSGDTCPPVSMVVAEAGKDGTLIGP